VNIPKKSIADRDLKQALLQ